MDVVGESHRLDTLRKLFPARLPADASLSETADLVPEPQNPHDRNAVAVFIRGSLVGYLARELAADYHELLRGFQDRGLRPQVPCELRAWEWTQSEYDRFDNERQVTTFNCSVRLSLAEPHLLAPVNAPPAQHHAVLPQGYAIQVTGEERHLDALLPHLPAAGEGWVYVTLVPLVEQTKTTTREVVEVRLDGTRVGQLTPKMSGELLAAIRHLDQAGYVTAARAMLRGNRLKVEVTIFTVRAHQIEAEWLDQFAPSSTEHTARTRPRPRSARGAACERIPIPSS